MTNPVAMGQRLRGIRACVFDAYGTLFDVTSAAQRCSGELGEITPRLAALWRDKQLQYSWLRTVQGHHADFWQVTGDALDFALDSLGIADPDLRERLMLLYLTLDAYPEVSGVLRQLRDVGFATAILSNGSPAMLTAAVDHAGLGAMFDHVLSIEDVGVYKPHPSAYRLACNHLGLPAGAIAFVSSNGWDAWSASAYGMRVFWCNRQRQVRERLPGSPDREIRSLIELPALLAG